ncbi:hypothetical protein V6Z12_D01G111200 [Gossypium hirsutum]
MSNHTKLEFVALDITRKNYLSWMLDVEIHLDAKGLGEAINEGNEASSQDNAKAMIFLCHHLHEGLKTESLNVKDPLVLRNGLKERYDHQKTIILPRAHYDWLHLRLQDFKFKKTYSTFHANNVVPQTQYREKCFKKYFELISCLLVAEQNNELLMKNHESRSIGSTPFSEANATSYNGKDKGHTSSCGRGHGRGRDRGRGQGRGHERGGKNHWSRTCHTPKHLVELYQQSLKDKGKKIETNFVCENGKYDYGIIGTTHLKVVDFFTTPEGNN